MREPNAFRPSLGFSALVHELQGRLASIELFCGELERVDFTLDEPRARERLARIRRSAVQMQRIMGAVKILESDSVPERSNIDVSSLVAQIVQWHRERDPAFQRVEVRVQSSMQLHANPDEIAIVLDNLLGNAFKYSSCRDRPRVCVSSTNGQYRNVIHVSDNGIGIAPEDQLRVFELFARAHPGYEGSGVGLAVARRIVERHGGLIWAQGEPGAGATISFHV